MNRDAVFYINFKDGYEFDASEGAANLCNASSYTASSGKLVIPNVMDDIKCFFKVKEKEYKITFDANGGTLTGESSKDVAYTKSYGTLPEPTREGYGFDGWYTEKYNGNRIDSSSILDTPEAKTLYAHWVDQTPPKCDVTKSNKSYTGLTLTVTCTDAESGCVEATKTYNNVTTSQTYQVKDNAGNVTTCDTATVTKATVYRKRTCSSCNSCGWVSPYYTCSQGTLINGNCVWNVSKSCSNCPNCTLDYWDSKAKVSYYTCSLTATYHAGYYRYPNDCGSCGCDSWSGWSDYNLSSCAGSSSVQCDSTTIYQ